MARHLEPYEYDENKVIRCGCGWLGPGRDACREFHKDLFDVSCPRCDRMLLIVPFPTVDDTRRAARRGNPRAIDALEAAEAYERRCKWFESVTLKEVSQLPELEGGVLEFVWDQVNDGPEYWKETTEITCAGTAVWREPMAWEGWWRFNEVKELLKKRYGARFRSLTPTKSSEMWLYGDDLSAKVAST